MVALEWESSHPSEPWQQELCPLLTGTEEWLAETQGRHYRECLDALVDAAGPALFTCECGIAHVVFPMLEEGRSEGAIVCGAVRVAAATTDELKATALRAGLSRKDLAGKLAALREMHIEELLSEGKQIWDLVMRLQQAMRQNRTEEDSDPSVAVSELREHSNISGDNNPEETTRGLSKGGDGYSEHPPEVPVGSTPEPSARDDPRPDNGNQRSRTTRRVVITGLGVVSPIGIGKETFIQGLRDGRNGVGTITLFDPSDMSSQVGGEVKDFDPSKYMDPKAVKRTGRSTQFAVAAAKQAIQDAGLNFEGADMNRVGVIIGSAAGGLEFGQHQVERYITGGSKGISPYLSIIIFAGACSSEVSMELRAKGPSITVSTGCAASNDAVGYGFQLIRDGKSDIVIAGGTEAPIFPVMHASFCALRALSTRNHDPDHASRPFDQERDGFVIAEGSALVVLEALEHARARGARIYGEILGYAATGDAFHMTRPSPDGADATRAMQLALQDADILSSEVQYISAHGSGTPLNDRTETAAIRSVFGKRAYDVPVSSIKSMLGHSIGASGAFDLVGILLGMQASMLPPTINLERPDPECDLDYVPQHSREKSYEVALSNSFGFGGKNACIVVTKWSGTNVCGLTESGGLTESEWIG